MFRTKITLRNRRLRKDDSDNEISSENQLNAVDIKATPSPNQRQPFILPDSQIQVSTFIDLILDSLKELNTRPTVSCENSYPAALRKKAYSKKEMRKIMKWQTSDKLEDKFIEKLKSNIANIPNFEKNYDYLLIKNQSENV